MQVRILPRSQKPVCDGQIKYGKKATKFFQWKQAEQERKTYVIEAVIVDGETVMRDEGDSRDEMIFLEYFPAGTAHRARLNEETNLITIL